VQHYETISGNEILRLNETAQRQHFLRSVHFASAFKLPRLGRAKLAGCAGPALGCRCSGLAPNAYHGRSVARPMVNTALRTHGPNTATRNIPLKGGVALLRGSVRRNNLECCGLLRFVAGVLSSWQPDVFRCSPYDVLSSQIIDGPAIYRARAVRLVRIEETGL
jgi:hypothetical protein